MYHKSSRIKHLFDIPSGDYNHHAMRVRDIVTKKAPNDIEKQKHLAKTMADKITNVDKAYGRYLVADEMDAPHLAKIFLNRFKELTYSLKDLRRDKILSFFDEIDEEETANS